MGPDFLITLPHAPLQPVEYLFERCRTSDEVAGSLFSKGSGYLLYKIVDDCVDYCFPMLRKIGNKLDRVEDDIFQGRSDEVVRDISNVKQEIINFRKTVRPQRPVLRGLERTKQRYLAEDMELYWDDIVDASERIWDMLENYKEVVEALEDTNESVLSHRQNDVLRALTAATVVFMPLTLVASIWGMNVRVPGEGELVGFFVVLAGMVALLVHGHRRVQTPGLAVGRAARPTGPRPPPALRCGRSALALADDVAAAAADALVVAAAAVQHVAAGAAVQPVVVVAAEEPVGPLAAAQTVVAVVAAQHVGAATAGEDVVAVVADDPVGAGAAEDVDVAPAALALVLAHGGDGALPVAPAAGRKIAPVASRASEQRRAARRAARSEWSMRQSLLGL